MTLAKISQYVAPCCPLGRAINASRCSFVVCSSTIVRATPFPSCVGPGHQTARPKRVPSNRVLPKYPSPICHTTIASQCPVVGSALNWQGQPQLQLQFTISSPAVRHLIFVGSLIFFYSFTKLYRFLGGFFSVFPTAF